MPGASIAIYEPAFDIVTPAYSPRANQINDDLLGAMVSLQLEWKASGGMWAGSMTLRADAIDSQDWFEHGIARHFELRDSAGIIAWEGFVNSVSRSIGTLQGQYGPLLDAANRLSVTYTPILDPTTAPITTGPITTTTIADNADSQAEFGILESVLSAGQLLQYGATNEATNLRDTVLVTSAWPESTENLNLSSTTIPTITLELLGYVHRAKNWIYADATAATVQYDTKIGLVIAQDPNGIMQVGAVDTNAQLTSRQEIENRTAHAILTDLETKGDGTNARFTIGMYADRRLYYRTQPAISAPLYIHLIGERSYNVYRASTQEIIEPWNILPAQWIFISDYPAIGSYPDLRRDPRRWFIESVSFTWPDTIAINGVKLSDLPQLLARMGVG